MSNIFLFLLKILKIIRNKLFDLNALIRNEFFFNKEFITILNKILSDKNIFYDYLD